MVGYSDPCPCCGNKRRRSTLDRWASWPRPSSAAQHPPPAKFARSASDPTPSAVAAAVKENDMRASSVPTALPSTAPPISSPGCPTPAPTAAGAYSFSTASDPSPSAEAEPKAKELNAKKEEEKEEKDGEMKTKAEIRVPQGVQIKICFDCKCGNSEQVILP